MLFILIALLLVTLGVTASLISEGLEELGAGVTFALVLVGFAMFVVLR